MFPTDDKFYSLLIKILGCAVVLVVVGNYLCALTGRTPPPDEIPRMIVIALVSLLVVPNKNSGGGPPKGTTVASS